VAYYAPSLTIQVEMAGKASYNVFQLYDFDFLWSLGPLYMAPYSHIFLYSSYYSHSSFPSCNEMVKLSGSEANAHLHHHLIHWHLPLPIPVMCSTVPWGSMRINGRIVCPPKKRNIRNNHGSNELKTRSLWKHMCFYVYIYIVSMYIYIYIL
jgi:hypothetical protein